MSGHKLSSGPGQHGAQQSAQHQSKGSKKHASSRQSQARGSLQWTSLTPQQQTALLAAETFWRAEIRQWFPALHSKTYFVPSLHVNKVSYKVKEVAGQPVLVPQEAPDQHPQLPDCFPPSGSPPLPSGPTLASQVWPSSQSVPPGPLPAVYDSDVRDDRAGQDVREYIDHLAETKQEVMLVLSQLDFRKYLDNQVDPITAAAVRLPIPVPATLKPALRRGDFDMLIINEQFSLIAIEVKSVGASSQTSNLSKAVIKVTKKAITQLDKEEEVLKHVTSDLASVRIIKTLALPNIGSQQLEGILATDVQLLQDLCKCLGVAGTDASAAVARCITADDICKPESSVWWQRTVTDHGPDANMTPELYERLAARFCGPATTIEVPTLTAPRHTVGLKTLSEGVALSGLTYSLLTLYPEQVNLVSRPDPRVFLHGPPGTGKTVLLALKAIQWWHQGKEVHLVSTNKDSRAATWLIEHQLLHATPTSATAPAPSSAKAPTLATTPASATATVPTSATAPTGDPKVYTHFYDFLEERHVTTAVDELASAERAGELYIIADEVLNGYFNFSRGRFTDFCTRLVCRVPSVHLWAAALLRDVTPKCMVEERLTRPVRCPPAVVRYVAKSQYIDDTEVPFYSSNSAIPAATDGPKVRQLPPHCQESSDGLYTLSPGHAGNAGDPEDCKTCADIIATLLTQELRVGQPGQPLHYHDVFILCDRIRDDMPAVTCLRACGVPVQTVKCNDDDSAVLDMALCKSDAVTVTHWTVAGGLERRVVVLLMSSKNTSSMHMLMSMSRCTSLLVWAGWSPRSETEGKKEEGEKGEGQEGKEGEGQEGKEGEGQEGEKQEGKEQRGEKEEGQEGEKGEGQRGEKGEGQEGEKGEGQEGEKGEGQEREKGEGQEGKKEEKQEGEKGEEQGGEKGEGQGGEKEEGHMGEKGEGQTGEKRERHIEEKGKEQGGEKSREDQEGEAESDGRERGGLERQEGGGA